MAMVCKVGGWALVQWVKVTHIWSFGMAKSSLQDLQQQSRIDVLGP